MKKKNLNIGILFLFIGLCLLIGIIGKFSMQEGKDTWYQALKKPYFFPPDYVFGPVWTILYTMMGVSLWKIYKSPTMKIKKAKAYYLFGLQLFLNLLWPFLFFGLKRPGFALVDLFFLWIAIILTLYEFKKIDKQASYLLWPYLLWVTFAFFLNFYSFKYLLFI